MHPNVKSPCVAVLGGQSFATKQHELAQFGVEVARANPEEEKHHGFHLRDPTAIPFISRDTCSDSIAKLSRGCFYGVSHNYRAISCKLGYRTDVPV